MSRKTLGLVLIFVLGYSSALVAADSPRMTWLKAKCAVCHGESGAGDTPEGVRRHVPDLRVDPVQKMTDKELVKSIDEGHMKMPAFKVQLSTDQVWMLVYYIRSIAKH